MGKGGRGVPAGHVDSLTWRMTSSHEAASRCSRVSLQMLLRFLATSSAANCRAVFPLPAFVTKTPCCGIRTGPSSKLRRRTVNPAFLVQTVIRLSKPGRLLGAYNNGTTTPRLALLVLWKRTVPFSSDESRDGPPLIRDCQTPAPVTAVPLSPTNGEMGPIIAMYDSRWPSKSVFSVLAWKPHSISTSMRFHAPTLGPITRIV